MFTSLRSRLWLTYAVVIAAALSVVAVAWLIYLLRNPIATRETVQRLRVLAAMASQRTEALNDLSPQQMQALAERTDENLDVRVVVLDAAGKVMADSRAGREPSFQSLSENKPVFNRLRDAKGRIWLVQTRPLAGGYTLLLAAPRPRVALWGILRDELLHPFLGAALLALLLSLLLAFWISRWVAAPLQRLAQGAREVSEGRYRPIPLEGPHEVKDLSRAFNEMVSRVQTTQQSQRDFVANVSHELKTPLTSIQGFAQAILDGAADTPQALHQAADVIYSEAARMFRLVLELLDLARLDARTMDFRRETVDLTALLRGIIEKFTPQAQRGLVTIKEEISSMPVITADNDRLSQVITNLVDNALKYTPAGGQIVVRARSQSGRVEVEVEDSGPGIPPAQLERIFERFYQLDKSRRGGGGRGVGLGLAIAREIIRAHGGEIAAHNSAAGGSVFVVKLPAG
jgi:signal transduction histidine kinase